MSALIGFARSKRGSTNTTSTSTSSGRLSVNSSSDTLPAFFFRMRSIRSSMSPDKLRMCFRDDFRHILHMRALVPGPLAEPEAVPELTAVAAIPLFNSDTISPNSLSSHILIDDHFSGFTCLYEPPETAVIDVIAIPAVAGHPFCSWMKQDASAGSEMWLQDLLPSVVPRARVLIYGHDHRTLEQGPEVITALATSLIKDLRMMRHKARLSQRPLVLIAHSSGGLVVKKALCDVPDLIEQELVRRVVFLGAPHDGLDRAAFNILPESLSSSPYAREFSAGSDTVLDLNSAFAPIADRLHIIAFYETKRTASVDSGSGKSVMIVPSDSATLFRNTERAVDCDHFDLARMAQEADGPYWEIVSELQSVITDVLKPAGWRIQNRGPASPTSPESVSEFFPESPTASLKGARPRSNHDQSAANKSRNKSIPGAFRRRSSTQTIPPQLLLHMAVRSNDMDEARRVLETFTELDAKDPARDNRTALHEAASLGNVEVATALLDGGALVEPRTRTSFRTPLHFAARDGQDELVRLLLDRSARINSRAGDQSTPLIVAVEKGHRHVVRTLLNRDANVHLERDRGVSALELAERFGHYEIVRMLKTKGARVNTDKPSSAPEYPGLF